MASWWLLLEVGVRSWWRGGSGEGNRPEIERRRRARRRHSGASQELILEGERAEREREVVRGSKAARQSLPEFGRERRIGRREEYQGLTGVSSE